MNTEQYIKTSEAISNHPTQVRGTYYRIAWCHNGEQGEEKDFYTSFASAVQIAEMLQQAAADRPIAVQFSVVRRVGQKIETVYRCQ